MHASEYAADITLDLLSGTAPKFKMNYLAVTSLLVVVSSSHARGLIKPVRLIAAVPVSLDHASHSRYAYNYAVSDPHTGDNKAQWEKREGGVVKGSYSLVEPDGNLRVVDYSADPLHGFNAVVKRLGPNIHPASLTPVALLKPVGLSAISVIRAEPIVTNLGKGIPLRVGAIGKGPIAPVKVSRPGWGSLPWDPLTGSYGGWVPIKGSSAAGPHITITSNKHGKGVWKSGPISIIKGRKIVVRQL